jgi:hypothetical protein
MCKDLILNLISGVHLTYTAYSGKARKGMRRGFPMNFLKGKYHLICCASAVK